jgi:hypothetical protein
VPPAPCRVKLLAGAMALAMALPGLAAAQPQSQPPAVAATPAPPPPPHAAGDYRVEINGGRPLFSQASEVAVAGTTDAPVGSTIQISIVLATPAAPDASPAAGVKRAAPAPPGPPAPLAPQPPQQTLVGAGGRFILLWPVRLGAGTYVVTVTVQPPTAPGGAGGPGAPGAPGATGAPEASGAGRTGSARQDLVVQLPGRFPRRPLLSVPESYAPPVESAAADFQEYTDRWRVVLPPYELTVPGSPLDPYNQNRLKGDLPIYGQSLFLNLSAVSDTLVEARELPTPAGISTSRPGTLSFFGHDGQLLVTQTIGVSADLFSGDTAFRPVDWRIKASLVGNVNYLEVAENGVVNPDVRQGTSRTDGFFAVQELFGEAKLADLSPNYDFVSVRAGIQPFNSDFRGFIFSDTNLGARLFGSYESNRDQFNLAFFDNLEKDTNSGLNTFNSRHQQVSVANLYRQDFLVPGYTAQASLHYLSDETSFHFDTDGFLVRPDPVGSFTPHAVHALYMGWTGLGHFGWLNVDHAFYYVTGSDSLNPIAGPDPSGGNHNFVDIRAEMAAVELSADHDWWRPKLAYFFASGDGNPTARVARGFDSIFDNPDFVGGDFSFWSRIGIMLPGLGVALVNRGSLLPDLRSSKEEGQPNFVNPGLQLASASVELDLTPRVRAQVTANYLRFDRTGTLELLLFQSPIRETIGWDLSLGARYRPFLNNHVALLGGVAALIPGAGFKDIYGDRGALLAAFTSLVLSF